MQVHITVNGVEFRYHSTGREGLAVDGSRDNIIRNNSIWANSAGGIFFLGLLFGRFFLSVRLSSFLQLSLMMQVMIIVC